MTAFTRLVPRSNKNACDLVILYQIKIKFKEINHSRCVRDEPLFSLGDYTLLYVNREPRVNDVKAKSKVRKETRGEEMKSRSFMGARTCCSRVRITSRRDLQILSRRGTGVRRVCQSFLHEPGQIGQLSFHVLHPYPATDNSRSEKRRG